MIFKIGRKHKASPEPTHGLVTRRSSYVQLGVVTDHCCVFTFAMLFSHARDRPVLNKFAP
jgi:hypothetical protein